MTEIAPNGDQTPASPVTRRRDAEVVQALQLARLRAMTATEKVAVMHHESTMRADVYPPGDDPLNHWALAHPASRRVDEVDVALAPVEVVIISKLRYYQMGGSSRHLRDIGR